MKTFAQSLGLLLLPAAVFAAQPSSAPARPPAELKELAAVEQFLALNDAELEQLQQVLARLRAMKPEERAALRDEIARYRQLPEGQRQQLRQGWGGMPREIQEAWREMMQNATPEHRAEVQARLQGLEPEARLAYRRQLVEAYLKSKDAKK